MGKKYKQYCGICDCETERDDDDVFEGSCPYHQKTMSVSYTHLTLPTNREV